MSVSRSEGPVDFAALGQAVGEGMQRRMAAEQEIIRRESETQTMLAQRRWKELFGERKWSPAASSAVATDRILPKPIHAKAVSKQKSRAIRRPGVTRMLQEAWATPEGKGKLLGLSLRALGRDLGVRHSSIRENPFFVQNILPLRARIRPSQQAADWIEKNARSRS